MVLSYYMAPRKNIFGFSPNVFVLSVVSFLNDVGGETIKRAIPLYLANILGVKTSVIGLIEGIAESTPHVFQPISGYLSDYFRRRKPLVIFGQILRSTMLFLFWAASWPQVLALRFLDRSGKGIGNAPRDALVASSSDRVNEGRSFGLNRAMDDAGSVVGMIAASLLVGSSILLTRVAFQRIVLLAVIPLVVSLLLLVFFLHDIPDGKKSETFRLKDAFGHRYYLFLFLSFLFALGNSSDAFLVLKSQLVGIPLSVIFLLLALLNLTASVSGLPLATLSDRIGRKRLLVGGWFLYAVVYVLLARATGLTEIVVAVVLYGLYYGATQGAAKAFVADVVPASRRGTAYGIYNLTVGATLLPASFLAGYLWQTFAPATAFYFGSGTAAVAALGLLLFL